MIGAWAPELVDQMLVRRRDLDTVHARALDAHRCGREVPHDAAHVMPLDDFGVAAVHRFTNPARGHEVRPALAEITGPPPHVGGLDEDPGAVLMHRLSQTAERLNDAVRAQIHRAPPALGTTE